MEFMFLSSFSLILLMALLTPESHMWTIQEGGPRAWSDKAVWTEGKSLKIPVGMWSQFSGSTQLLTSESWSYSL